MKRGDWTDAAASGRPSRIVIREVFVVPSSSRDPTAWSHSGHPSAEHGYRRDVDGLRAVAVLGVVVYHAAPGSLPGGFAGVDVFFVISGFLISGIIFRALERGTFSLLDFYARRVKRIFPALIAMMIVVWMIAWPILLWDEYRLLGKHILAGAAFALNLVLYSDFNVYFGVTTTPLIHLWSLGVEEQFYIVWPLLLIASWKLGGARVRLVGISAVAAASFTMNILALSADPTASFYLPSSRMWELAIGSLLAYLTMPGHTVLSRRPNMPAWLEAGAPHVLGLLGTLLLLGSFVGLRSSFAFPGWWALGPAVGAALLIFAGERSWFNRRVLGSSPMVYIGLISYPLYLWHWPLLSMVHIFKGGEHSWPLIGTAVASAFVLAILTFKYIELPIRSSRKQIQFAAGLCAAMSACAVVGYVTFAGSIAARSERYDLNRQISASREDWLSEQRTEWTWYTDFLALGADSHQTLFIGDSNMQQYYPRIEELLASELGRDRGATFAVRAGCAPAVIDLLEASSHFVRTCKAFLEQADALAKSSRVDTIVIGALWRAYVGPNWRQFAPQAPLHPQTEAKLAELAAMIRDLVHRGKRVYVVLNIPISPHYDPRLMIRRTLTDGFKVDVHTPSRADVEAAIGPITSRLRQVATDAGARVIDPMVSLCTEQVCPAVAANGEPMYRDPGHLRPSFVRHHIQFLDATVLDSPAHPASASLTAHGH